MDDVTISNENDILLAFYDLEIVFYCFFVKHSLMQCKLLTHGFCDIYTYLLVVVNWCLHSNIKPGSICVLVALGSSETHNVRVFDVWFVIPSKICLHGFIEGSQLLYSILSK